MVLVNGANGIGTGWNTFIPSYNPRDIIENIRRLLQGEGLKQMHPWYRNFKGEVAPTKTPNEGPCTSYTITGLYDVKDNIIHIKELPVYTWTNNYISFLEKMKKGGFIEDYKNDSDGLSIDIKLILSEEQMKLFLDKQDRGIFLKLTRTISTRNMHLLDRSKVIRKYDTPEKILEDYFVGRLEKYEERKRFMVKKLSHELAKLENKLAFIEGVLSGDIKINSDLDNILQEKRFKKLAKSIDATGDAKSYDYMSEVELVVMVRTPEKIRELKAERDAVEKKLLYYEQATAESLWYNDLSDLIRELET